MYIFISSGNGVDEVCRALWHFYHWLEKSYDFKVLELQKARCKNGIKSLLLESDDKKFLEIEGTILWQSLSPFRPKHKRKNWYFSLKCYEQIAIEEIDESKILYQTMKSPKKGGQHVNTTSSGVRAIYVPLGIEAICFDERSQHRNKALVRSRLLGKILLDQSKNKQKQKSQRWRDGKGFQRGDEVLVFTDVL